MISEDDDDTHICLKCHATINGLDNYVTHRKTGCQVQPSHSKPRTLSPLIPPDEPDFSLKADDFFSLLELQSSSKKSSLPHSGGKGVLTRSKATAVIQASNTKSDWIGGHQLRELGNEDNQTKLIKAVDNISGNIKKDEPARLSYEDELEEESNDEYEDEDEDFEEECHNAPPRTHTGGKWKPTTSPIQWLRPSSSHSHDQEERSEWEPPPNHTGGKWKPTPPPQRRLSDEDDKNAPPPDHTKGKWIPGHNSLETSSLEEIPPLRKSSGTVQYWCGPCNRRLASKIVYERHLKSELHYKRTLHEREFENSDYSNQQSVSKRADGKRKIKRPENWMNPMKRTKSEDEETDVKLKKQNYIRCEVCKTKVKNHLIGKHLISHYHCRKRNSSRTISHQMILDHIWGVVLQSPFQCSICRFYCNEEQQFLYHWRSDDHASLADTTVGIYLCSFCKYETKYNDLMEQHLLSETHREVVSVINRSVPIIIKKIVPVNCDTCNQFFRYNAELRRHCLREGHILSNSSTDKYQERHICPHCPLILKSYKALQRHLVKKHEKSLFFCSTCSLTFETELESKVHRKTSMHKYAVIARNYEKGIIDKDISRMCQYCYIRLPNVMFLKEHLKKEHPEHSYSCTQCGLKFTLPQEVSQHMKTKSCSFPSTSASSSLYSCEKCPYESNSEAELIFHLALHNDPIMSPGRNEERDEIEKRKIFMYKCPVCEKTFRKSSLRCHVRRHVNERPFKCEKCKAAYTRKSNLVDHVKTRHSDEFQDRSKETDKISGKNFEQRTELSRSRRNEEMQKKEDVLRREKKYLCADCGKSFLKKFTLQQHACTHTGKKYPCVQTGCVYQARSSAELKIHAVTHANDKPFACMQCEHRTKTKAQLTRHVRIHEGEEGKKYHCSFCTFSARIRSHLKRHLRLHTGAKPYRCPHCEYACNNLENLRKHILLTNKHPGKSIYTCTWCPAEEEFATNFAKEFHVHLVKEHSDRFDTNSAKEAVSRLVGIYNKEEDERVVEGSSNESGKRPRLPPAPSLLYPSSTSSTFLPIASTSTATSSTSGGLMDPELLSMSLVVVKEDVVLVAAEAWPMEGFYSEAAITDLEEEDMLGGKGFEDDE